MYQKYYTKQNFQPVSITRALTCASAAAALINYGSEDVNDYLMDAISGLFNNSDGLLPTLYDSGIENNIYCSDCAFNDFSCVYNYLVNTEITNTETILLIYKCSTITEDIIKTQLFTDSSYNSLYDEKYSSQLGFYQSNTISATKLYDSGTINDFTFQIWNILGTISENIPNNKGKNLNIVMFNIASDNKKLDELPTSEQMLTNYSNYSDFINSIMEQIK